MVLPAGSVPLTSSVLHQPWLAARIVEEGAQIWRDRACVAPGGLAQSPSIVRFLKRSASRIAADDLRSSVRYRISLSLVVSTCETKGILVPCHSVIRMIYQTMLALSVPWVISCGPANFDARDPNPADVGPTHPNELLIYVPFDGAAAFCATPDQLLNELRRAVLAAAQQTDGKPCNASITSDATMGPTLSLQCPLTPAIEKCQEVYSARIWTERDRGSLTNYQVKAFGWLQWACIGSDSVYETTSRHMTRGTSATLESVLSRCRRTTVP